MSTVVDAPPTLARAIGKKDVLFSVRLLRQGDLIDLSRSGGWSQSAGGVLLSNSTTTFNAVCSNFIGRIAVAPDMWSTILDVCPCELVLESSQRVPAPKTDAVAVSKDLTPECLLQSKSQPFPPLSQQRAIADYLNRETARLDALVAAKERVIGLLAEKRRALITRAVTRGLDPQTSHSATPASPGSARSRRIGRLNARDGCSGSAMNAPTRERRNSSLCRTSLA